MQNKMLKVICAIFLLFAMSHEAFASYPSYNTETDCRSCHGIVADRHHLLVANGTYVCSDCHAVKYDTTNQTYYPEVIRNCLICHVGKDHTEVHHLLVQQGLFVCSDCHPMKYDAQNKTYYPEIIWDCTVCHSTVLSPGSPVPTPEPSPKNPPAITSFSPLPPTLDITGATRTFNVTFDQTVNLTWSIDGTPVQDNNSITKASYINSSAVPGVLTVSVNASNVNGSAMFTWIWNVTPIVIDNTLPQITINAPINGKVYIMNQKVFADWSVRDASGIASATGTYPNGSAINTASVGTKNFSVYAKDNAGNTNTTNVTYYIRYKFSGFLEPISPDGSSIFRSGSKVQIRFRLSDANLKNVANAVARLNFNLITPIITGRNLKPYSYDTATTSGLFKYDSMKNWYYFQLDTKGLQTGTWQIRVDINDGSSYSANISLRNI